jgi:FkbM family methyltransferase
MNIVKKLLLKQRKKLLNPVLSQMDRLIFLTEKIDEFLSEYIAQIEKNNTGISSTTKPTLAYQLSNNTIIGNEKLAITKVSGREKSFFWVTRMESKDPISEDARNGLVDINEELKGFFPKNSIFMDIGANIGAFCLSYAADGWTGYAIEASSNNANILRASIMLNDFDIVLCEKAVYDKTGDIYFFQSGPYGFVKNSVTQGNYEKIECICLDDYKDTILKDITHIDLIKMDIEGSELAAIRGMKKFLQNINYPPIFMERNLHCLNWQNETSVSFFREMNMLGYRPYCLEGANLREQNPADFPIIVCTDFLFIKEMSLNFSGEILPPEKQDKEATLSFIISKLDEIVDGNLLDLCAYVCSNLKDYPQYTAISEVKERLEKIIIKSRDADPYVQSVIAWYKAENKQN